MLLRYINTLMALRVFILYVKEEANQPVNRTGVAMATRVRRRFSCLCNCLI